MLVAAGEYGLDKKELGVMIKEACPGAQKLRDLTSADLAKVKKQLATRHLEERQQH